MNSVTSKTHAFRANCMEESDPMGTQVLHQTLKNARMAAGLSMEQVAQRTGISQSTLSRIEAKKAKVSSQRLIDLAAAYGCSPSALLDGSVVRSMSETDLTRIGQVIEFVEETLSQQLPRPAPKTISETVLAIFRQETASVHDTGSEFDPSRYRDLINILIKKE